MGRRHDAGVRGQPGYVRAVVAFAADVSAAEGTIFTLNFRALQGGSTMVYLSGESYLTGVPLSLHPVASITVESGSPVIPPPYDPDRPGGETDIPDGETPTGNLPQTGSVAGQVENRWTLGVLALMASMAAAGLSIVISRRKEEEK